MEMLSRNSLDPTRVPGVVVIDFIPKFIAGKLNFARIDDDDVISCVHIWGENGFMLATENGCHLSGKTANRFSFGVHNKPFSFNL
jgi:hypothetical protein